MTKKLTHLDILKYALLMVEYLKEIFLVTHLKLNVLVYDNNQLIMGLGDFICDHTYDVSRIRLDSSIILSMDELKSVVAHLFSHFLSREHLLMYLLTLTMAERSASALYKISSMGFLRIAMRMLKGLVKILKDW